MCRCEDCVYFKFSRGGSRGVMDCDPDEYYCSKSYTPYWYEDDEEEETCSEFEEAIHYIDNDRW